MIERSLLSLFLGARPSTGSSLCALQGWRSVVGHSPLSLHGVLLLLHLCPSAAVAVAFCCCVSIAHPAVRSIFHLLFSFRFLYLVCK